MSAVQILQGDCREVLRALDDESVNCCVTSPPYFGLRDYGVAGQIGLEPTPGEYVAELVEVFREVRRVLRPDGTLWLNLGDSYACNGTNRNGIGNSQIGSGPTGACKARAIAGSTKSSVPPGLKPKDLIGIPWRVAFALQADGWYLRSDIIWHKPNPMPESVTDRPTSAHEHVFLLAKSERYFFDAEAIREPFADKRMGNPGGGGAYSVGSGRCDKGALATGRWTKGADVGGRNARNVWSIASRPFKGAHFATFPPDLAERCIKAGCPEGGTVLDPFGGAGTTGLVADRLGRNAILIELNPEYAAMAERRIESAPAVQMSLVDLDALADDMAKMEAVAF